MTAPRHGDGSTPATTLVTMDNTNISHMYCNRSIKYIHKRIVPNEKRIDFVVYIK